MRTEEYERGFEDCAELCLDELISAENLEKAKGEIEKIIGLLKERKFERLKKMLWIL